VEQIVARLLAEMNVIQRRTETKKIIREKIDSNQEIMEAKIKTIQEKMDDGQEVMKVQVGSFSSRIEVSQKEMKAMLDACLEKNVRKIQENCSPRRWVRRSLRKRPQWNLLEH
jgi:hypothetical protein